jgi:hypothetical protein
MAKKSTPTKPPILTKPRVIEPLAADPGGGIDPWGREELDGQESDGQELDYATMTLAERLARAALMFCHSGAWTPRHSLIWLELTGRTEATTKVFCDLARRVVEEERLVAEMAEGPEGEGPPRDEL